MDGFLKQSTAAQVRWIGPFVDDTDFKTAETALTIANTDIKVSKNGGASASKNSGGGTHDVNGMYAVTWDATDTATVGELKYSVKVAGALQVFGSYVVLEEEVYDDVFGASAVGYLKPTTAGRDLDVSAGGEAGVDWGNVGSPTTAVDLSGTTIKTTQKVDVDTIKTGAVVNGGTVTFPTNATLASTTNITAGTITTVTNLTNAATAGDLTATMKASVNTEADTALSDVGLTSTVTGRIDAAITTRTKPADTQAAVTLVATTTNLTNPPPWNAAWDAEVQSEVDDALNTTIADSIPADGTAPSVRQALYMLTQFMLERSVASTTLTVAKPDGTTALFTLTLNDATTPTAITRAT